MQKDAILSEVFFARIQAVEALLSARTNSSNAAELKELGTKLDGLSIRYGRASTAMAYSAFAGIVRIISTLIEWRAAVLEAMPDADRFLRSAQERYQLWRQEYATSEPAKGLVQVCQHIGRLTSVGEVAALCHALASTPLPIGVFAEERLQFPRPQVGTERRPEPTELSVAFLKFQIDSRPANELHHLTPGDVHDLEIEVRVSRWPEIGKQLQLTPITIEPNSTYDFPTFTFERPSGEPPFTVAQRGRALLKVSQGLHARPFEFKYAAGFLPSNVEQPVAVIGHRTLLIEGLNFQVHPVSGYPVIDKRILEIRDLLRQSSVIENELKDTLTILVPLCNLAGRAVQDAEFDRVFTEAEFQSNVRAELRRRPEIGAELDEHACAGGGITDLSFHGVPIELKSESKKLLRLADCERFVDQTVSYAVAKGKRVGILCVLDCSLKTSPPQPADAGIGIFHRSTDAGSIAVCVVLIQGHLARPSSHSR